MSRLETTVGAAFKVLGGGTPATAEPSFWAGEIPWATSADINDDLSVTPRKTISRKAVEKSATNLVPRGSVLVATRVGLGKVGIADVELCFSQDNQGLVFDSREWDTKFVAHQMKLRVQHFRFVSRGTTIAGVTKKQLLDVPITKPPLPEQRRIVAKIEKQFTRLDAGVAALRRVQANLKRYRAAVLKAACEGRLVPTEAELARKERRTFETGEQLLQRILADRRSKWKGRGKYSEPSGPIMPCYTAPSGWTFAAMRQAGEVQLGRQRAPQHHTGDHMRPYLRVANVFEARIDTADVMEMNFTPTEFEKYRLRFGDILLNEGQTPELVGRPAMFRDEVNDCCYQKTLIRFRAADGVVPAYALTVFRSHMHSGRFKKAASITTNIAHLTAEKFIEIEFPLPPLTEQKRIVVEVERRLSVIDELESDVTANLARATRLRQSILQQAFSGKSPSTNGLHESPN